MKDGSGVNKKDEEDLGNGPEIPKTLEFESDKLSQTGEQVHGEKYKQEPEINTGSGKAIRHIVESGEEKHKKVKTLTTIAMEAGRKSGKGNNMVPEFEKEKELDKRKSKEIDKEGKTGEDKEGKTDEDKEGKTDEDKEGKTDEDKEGKTDEDKEGKTDEYKEGKTDEDKGGKTDEDKEGKTDEDKEGKTDEDKDGKKAENEDDNDSVKENEEPNRQKEELKGI